MSKKATKQSRKTRRRKEQQRAAGVAGNNIQMTVRRERWRKSEELKQVVFLGMMFSGLGALSRSRPIDSIGERVCGCTAGCSQCGRAPTTFTVVR